MNVLRRGILEMSSQNLVITSVSSSAQNPEGTGVGKEYADGLNDCKQTKEFGEELGEKKEGSEETMIDQNIGNYSKPIYKGEGFRSSTFNDSDCGEPSRTQHIRIDFSPVKGLDDNEYIVSKCLDFWTFLEKHPEVKGLRAIPTSPDYKDPKTLDTLTDMSDNSEIKAMDWLKCKDLLSDAFSTKHKDRFCSTGNRENCANWTSQKRWTKRSDALKASQRSIIRKSAQEDVGILSKQLQEWDLLHPKSMKGPGQPPKLTHVVMHK